MSVRTHKVEPVKGQALLTSSKTKQDVKPSLVSPPSLIMASRSPSLNQKTSRRVASLVEDIENANIETTNISSSSCDTSKWTGNFNHMLELRRKIITFRGIIDLPPLTGYRSITNMVMRTMEDLHKLCPEIVESSCLLDIRHADTDKQQLLDQFYNTLKSIGDSWIDDHEWIAKSKYRNSNSLGKNLSDGLGNHSKKFYATLFFLNNDFSKQEVLQDLIEFLAVGKVLAALDGLITGSNEMLNMTEINIEEKKPKVNTPSQSKTPSKRASLPSESFTKQPITPRTVLHPPSKVRDIKISASNLPRHMRMQALVVLIPINVKKLTIKKRMCQKEAQSNDGDGDNESVKKKQKSETERIEKMEKANEATPEDKSYSKVSEESETVPESLALTPPLPGNAALPSLQPLPMTAERGQAAPPQPPGVATPLPPPPLLKAPGKGSGTPPPPPPRLGAKKATGKLKRSTKLGELYRFLKAKIEGKDPKPRSRGVGGGGSKGVGGKQGMADALAEITKKSPYFQQIEADVKMYMKAINELKAEISSFKSKDMTELQRFHLYIESVLEKLTDERQVLARCEGFPEDKLDAIRMASALHSKLQGMINELKNWKIESPANLLFDKTERYFSKASHRNCYGCFFFHTREIETLDQIKAEDEKTFKRHNIPFDFSILTQIKESMVDISSGCIELALKEKREAKIASHTADSRKAKSSMIKNKTVGFAKTLWKAFHFAYKVYIFAGGHDDRADKLTRELGSEIELVLKNQ
ncbi:hypothetical protein IGI04_038779 [Brassica rapa subsp. trilocularis]|uniref:Hydroxyproline-rich glycoprotein family protein n=1 Tax=Brassica rapa subsp. trilocularis TaxID=1813537 RepID=A0ABQ7LL78_BRACM|nr:hypothetical protein IGI04_038779 [Brassica rapa subsp. trilocularis]